MSDDHTRQDRDEQAEDLEVTPDQAEDVKGGAEITSPRDPASGLPTGKRQHKPFTYIGETEKS